MTKRALVIGSQTRGLTGVENDAQRMAKLLGERGFACDLRIGKDATREQILGGYDALIANTAVDDCAVMYYSGHGEYCRNVDTTATPREFQAIIPHDYDAADDDDYRGITSIELSLKLRQLTDRSKNVTVILDCCHSSQMSRDGAARDAVARALPHPNRFELARHIVALEKRYPGQLARLGPQGNPDAVRMVACAQTESAYEYTNTSGARTGAFTEALVEILTEIGDAGVSWALVGNAVRQRVLQRFPSQRPEVEGPSRRQLFSLAEQPPSDVVGVMTRNGIYQIDAGRIHSVTVGDKYDIAPRFSQDHPTAHAVVTQTRATISVVDVDGPVPTDPVGIPTERAAVKQAITVIAPAESRAAIEREIAASRTLCVAADGEDAAVATLRLVGDQLTIEDKLGPLFASATYPTAIHAVVQNLANMGAARRLRELEGEGGIAASQLEVEWGVVENGLPRPMPDHGTALGLGDRIYCRVKNPAPRNVYVHIFNVGLRGKISLLTDYAPAGVKLGLGMEQLLGYELDGTLSGLGLSWPVDLPKDTFPRLDTLVVIATTTPANLTALETVEIAMRGMIRRSVSGLEQLLGQLQTGNTRDTEKTAPLDAYLIKRLTYFLHPREGRVTSKSFLIDDAPSGQSAARSAEAWQPTVASPPRRIAVRLADLVIDDNHAWFATDVRIDALVLTRGDAPAPGYLPQTIPFGRVTNGQRLPIENSLLFLGEVRDFVDICLWVSRNTANSPSLPQLLANQAQRPEVKDAFTALLTTAGVVATPWVAAVAASAVLAGIAYEAILAAAGTTIGLFRTSFLAHEQFGIGRYPRTGNYRAQDFSFSLLIESVT
jgi:Caspase domain